MMKIFLTYLTVAITPLLTMNAHADEQKSESIIVVNSKTVANINDRKQTNQDSFTLNRDLNKLPSSFDMKISLDFDSIPLKSIFHIFDEFTSVNIITQPELKEVPIKIKRHDYHLETIFHELLSKNNLTYKVIAPDTIYILENDDYLNCVVDNLYTLNADSLVNKGYQDLASEELTVVFENVKVIKAISSLHYATEQELVVDKGYIFKYWGNRTKPKTVNFSLKNAPLDKILLLLSLQSELSFRYLPTGEIEFYQQNFTECTDVI